MCAETLFQRRKKCVRISKEETLLILRSYREHATRWADVVDEVRWNTDRLSEQAKELFSTGTLKQLRDRMAVQISKLLKSRENIQDPDIREEVELVRAQERRLVQPIHTEVEPRQTQAVSTSQVALTPQGVTSPRRTPVQLVTPPRRSPAKRTTSQHVTSPRRVPLVVATPLRATSQDITSPRRPVAQSMTPPQRDANQVPRQAAQRQVADRRDSIAAGLSSDDEVANEPPRRRRRLADLIRENNELYNNFMKNVLPRMLNEYGIDLIE